VEERGFDPAAYLGAGAAGTDTGVVNRCDAREPLGLPAAYTPADVAAAYSGRAPVPHPDLGEAQRGSRALTGRRPVVLTGPVSENVIIAHNFRWSGRLLNDSVDAEPIAASSSCTSSAESWNPTNGSGSHRPQIRLLYPSPQRHCESLGQKICRSGSDYSGDTEARRVASSRECELITEGSLTRRR
jgi:hypothetical protein